MIAEPLIAMTLLLFSLTGVHSRAVSECSLPGSPFSITKMSGTIKSPGYPVSYKANENCTWAIRPPYRPQSAKIAIVTIVNVDMREDGQTIPNTCYGVNTFVKIDTATACGKEGPTCIAYILDSSDTKCKVKAALRYPQCHSLSYTGWPLNIHLQTQFAAQKPGFHIDYEFMDCSLNKDPFPSRNVTEPATTTNLVQAIATTAAEQGAPDVSLSGSGSGAPIKTVWIIIIGVLLVVFLLVIIGIVVMRKNIREWMNCNKTNFHQGTQKQSVPYSEKCMIPNTATTTVGYGSPMKNESPPLTPTTPPLSDNNNKESAPNLVGPLTISSSVYERI